MKNGIKAAFRRQGIHCRGVRVYGRTGRSEALKKLPNAALRWQMQSFYRRLDALRRERVGAHRMLKKQVRGMGAVRRLQTIPGVGPVTARTITAWVVDPLRFRSRRASPTGSRRAVPAPRNGASGS